MLKLALLKKRICMLDSRRRWKQVDAMLKKYCGARKSWDRERDGWAVVLFSLPSRWSSFAADGSAHTTLHTHHRFIPYHIVQHIIFSSDQELY